VAGVGHVDVLALAVHDRPAAARRLRARRAADVLARHALLARRAGSRRRAGVAFVGGGLEQIAAAGGGERERDDEGAAHQKRPVIARPASVGETTGVILACTRSSARERITAPAMATPLPTTTAAIEMPH